VAAQRARSGWRAVSSSSAWVWPLREMAARASDTGVLGLAGEDEPRPARRESHPSRGR
jgi:hypothetical protein